MDGRLLLRLLESMLALDGCRARIEEPLLIEAGRAGGGAGRGRFPVGGCGCVVDCAETLLNVFSSLYPSSLTYEACPKGSVESSESVSRAGAGAAGAGGVVDAVEVGVVDVAIQDPV